MAIRIRTIKKGRPIQVYIKSLDEHLKTSVALPLAGIRDRILKSTRSYIDSHRVRRKEKHQEDWRTSRTNNLFNSIKEGTSIKQTGPHKWVLGIGELRYLNKHAPYWYLVNYGGKIDMGKWEGIPGYFDKGQAPSKGGGGGVFSHTDGFKGQNPYSWTKGKSGSSYGNSFLMKPVRPIPPMYYLNHMVDVFVYEMNRFNLDIRKKTRSI